MNSLLIHSGQGDYSVDFFEKIDTLVNAVLTHESSVVIIDRNVASLYQTQFKPLLDHIPFLVMDATEDEKTLDGIEKVLSFFQENNLTRQSIVLAIGGGVIQDIVTFSSHIYYRGIRWMFIPTTLLSMGDSCIGAKCGINFKNNKNQLGIFQSPSYVAICTEFINTLSEHDVLSGYGEILKLMLTGSKELYENYSRVITKNLPTIDEAQQFIFQSLNVKKQVIEKDEYENDYRRILNYGHTFGHALESITRYEIPHGAAVAWGVDLANYLSWKMGFLSEEDFMKIHTFINARFQFSLSVPVKVLDLIQATKRDKKMTQGKANLILLRFPGKLEIESVEYNEQLNSLVSEYFKKYNVIYWN